MGCTQNKCPALRSLLRGGTTQLLDSFFSLLRLEAAASSGCRPWCRCNQRSWLYRIRPSVTHEPFHPLDFASEVFSGDFERAVITPNQLRWRPFSVPDEPVDFVRGLFTICGAGRCAAPLCHRELLRSRGEARNPAACDFPECGTTWLRSVRPCVSILPGAHVYFVRICEVRCTVSPCRMS